MQPIPPASGTPANPYPGTGVTTTAPRPLQPITGTPTAGIVAPIQPVPADPAQEQADYKTAFDLLKSGRYDEAMTAYNSFLLRYPNGRYAANARYWLGEANYVTRRFTQALSEFQKVIGSHPDSQKAPDAMLKIGYIHYELQQPDQARQILTGLKQQHPGTTAARLAENRLQKMKLENR